jgi:ubiquinol-cytochrome c reductase cytochrome c1 subunit
VLSLVSASAFACSGAALDHVAIVGSNEGSLERGAKTFMNYCLGCHSADYQRYNRMAEDIGLSSEEVLENLIFTTDKAGEKTKIGSLMFSNMNKDYGKEAFGAAPPNLALVARSRGTDWLYTYLRTFYLDASRPVGVNNLVFKGVGMPHVLWELEGLKKPIYKMEKDAAGHEHEVLEGFEQVVEGKLTSAEYDRTIGDLVNFMAYIADPIKVERQRIGLFVILFLFVLLGVAIMLKKEYWKDVVK